MALPVFKSYLAQARTALFRFETIVTADPAKLPKYWLPKQKPETRRGDAKLAGRHDGRKCEIRMAAAVWTFPLEISPPKILPFLGASSAKRNAMHAVIAKPKAADTVSFEGGFHPPKLVSPPTKYAAETD